MRGLFVCVVAAIAFAVAGIGIAWRRLERLRAAVRAEVRERRDVRAWHATLLAHPAWRDLAPIVATRLPGAVGGSLPHGYRLVRLVMRDSIGLPCHPAADDAACLCAYVRGPSLVRATMELGTHRVTFLELDEESWPSELEAGPPSSRRSPSVRPTEQPSARGVMVAP